MAAVPQVVSDLMALDDDNFAIWMLRQLADAPDIEQGENFIGEQLVRWFPGQRGIGVVQTIVPGSVIPAVDPSKPVEARLRDTYVQLMSRRWIEPDPSSGKTFCKLTPVGQAQLAAPSDMTGS